MEEGRLTVGEAVLLGLLDVCAKGEDVGKSLKSVAGLTKAWIGDARQVILESIGAPKDNVLSPAIGRLPPLAVPAPARSPRGREKERDSLRSESPTITLTMNNRYSPTTRSSSPQSDRSSIKKPAAVVSKVPVSITPPIGPDVLSTSDHPCNWLATPSDSSTENGTTEYETCETYATATNDFTAHLKAANDPDPYDPYHTAFFDPNWSQVDDSEFGVLADDAPARKMGVLKGRLSFKNLSKAMSVSGTAAPSISSMAVSTIGKRWTLRRRDRDVLRPVVV